MNTIEFVQYLAFKYARFAPALQEHFEFNEEILPHVFLGDLVRLLEKSVLENNIDEEELSNLINDMENYLANGSEEVQNLIVVSFLENFEGDSILYEKGKGFFGERLSYYYDLLWNVNKNRM